MYKMNKLLKLIIVILTIIIVVITNNRIVLWLLLFLLSFYNLHRSNRLLLLVDLILVVLLGLSVKEEVFLLIFKIVFIINFLITIFTSLTIDDKKQLFKRKTASKLMYFEDNFDKIVNRINERKNEMYDKDVSINNKIKSDLERSYLQAKIRYFGYASKKQKKKIVWSKIDTLILILTIIIFVILFILR